MSVPIRLIGYKLASAMLADSPDNLQLSQRNDGPESATIARDRSLQSRKGKYSRRGTCDTTKVPLHDRINQFPNQITRINDLWSTCHGF